MSKMSELDIWMENYNRTFNAQLSFPDLVKDNAELKRKLEEAWQTIEDLALGASQECRPEWLTKQ